jgi:hypothetical protein
VNGTQAGWLALGGLAVLCLALALSMVLTRRARQRERARDRAEVADLQARLDELERAPQASTSPAEFVITGLGREQTEDTEPAAVDGAVFADTVLRETVVKAASFAHGVRRGLAPATRNRIRFEMKQEVRRARKQRRTDLKAAQRDLHARQRATLAEDAT